MTEVIDITNAAEQASRTASWWQRVGSLLGLSQDGKRDTWDIYGYPQNLGSDTGFDLMYRWARRQGIANRLTFGVSHPCWRDGFELRADPDDDGSVQMEDELKLLVELGLVTALERADILNRIGRFSLLLVGTQDNADLSTPLGRGGNLETIYFQPYAYDGVRVSRYVTDQTDRRYGQPELYTVQRRNRADSKTSPAVTSRVIHWSRLVHLSEYALDDANEGTGALEPVFNRILDLDKTCGGSAEAYFRNARGKVAYEIDPEFAVNLVNDPVAKEQFDEGARKFTNEWQDHTIASGATVKGINTPQQSPLDTVKSALWEISGYSGIPIRILTGEGAGQLAGSEDQLAFNQMIADRQRVVCSPWVRRVMSILTDAGLLNYDPQWYVVFPPQQAATEMQRSEIDERRARSLETVTRAVSQPGGDTVVLESALEAVGLGEIEIDESLPELEPDPEPLPEPPAEPAE